MPRMFVKRKKSKKEIKKKKRKASASKRYVSFSIGLVCAVTLYAMIIEPLFGAILMLNYLIPAAYGNLATALGFYFNKAKKENSVGGITYDLAMQGNNDDTAG